MKEKQGNKPNSYGKLMKRMLIYLGIGGVCGFFVGIFYDVRSEKWHE